MNEHAITSGLGTIITSGLLFFLLWCITFKVDEKFRSAQCLYAMLMLMLMFFSSYTFAEDAWGSAYGFYGGIASLLVALAMYVLLRRTQLRRTASRSI